MARRPRSARSARSASASSRPARSRTVLVASPVLLLAGAPVRRLYLRSVYRDEAPPVLDKRQGRISVHRFVVTSPLLAWLCRPTESLARLISRRG
ncbi:hypothetical protein ABZX93_15210 [Streptomyces sp. NPDC006632]|uniref:hypothetical protein n=1 Tax=Streptomyces sp. NPDC006632 TaxID=3157182 RepID=UPI0033AD12B9